MRLPIETRLLDLIETHPLAASLSAGAAFAWLRLGRATDRSGELDTFRLRPGLATLDELARAFRLSVTEAARGLHELIRKGCLLVIAGGFQLPEWTGIASRKAVSARKNGRKHVGTDPEKQRRLPLLASVTGGASLVTHATTTTQNLSLERKVVVAPEPASVTEAEAVAQELGGLIGLTGVQAGRSAAQVEVWLRQGVSVDAMREGIRRVLSRPNLPPITGLGYFAGAILDAQGSRPPASLSVEEIEVDPVEQRARRAWSDAIVAWNNNGRAGARPLVEDFIERARLRTAA